LLLKNPATGSFGLAGSVARNFILLAGCGVLVLALLAVLIVVVVLRRRKPKPA